MSKGMGTVSSIFRACVRMLVVLALRDSCTRSAALMYERAISKGGREKKGERASVPQPVSQFCPPPNTRLGMFPPLRAHANVGREKRDSGRIGGNQGRYLFEKETSNMCLAVFFLRAPFPFRTCHHILAIHSRYKSHRPENSAKPGVHLQT